MKILKKITISLKNSSYPILIGENILKNFNQHYLRYCKNSKKILIISNKKIPKKYINELKKTISKKNKKYILMIPAG